MSNETDISEKESINKKVNRLNSLLFEVQAYKQANPDERVSWWAGNVGSLLNAYREGDISFADCVAEINDKENASVQKAQEEITEIRQTLYQERQDHAESLKHTKELASKMLKEKEHTVRLAVFAEILEVITPMYQEAAWHPFYRNAAQEIFDKIEEIRDQKQP